MPKICYQSTKFSAGSLAIIDKANEICDELAEQGYDLTLRQLYYQFVSRGLIENRQTEYKRLGSIVNDGRLAGLIDWLRIEDRTRGLKDVGTWDDPADMVRSDVQAFAIDKWEDQPFRVEVWVEKDALVGVVETACEPLAVPYLSCRGYTSQSEMWRAAQRLQRWSKAGQRPFVIHLGDHDPSGKDMSRDIQDRLALFTGGRIKFERIALNMDQVEQYQPPPNPAKITDSRAHGYIAAFGDESWELDALEPAVLTELIQGAVLSVRDEELWEAKVEQEDAGRRQLAAISERFDAVVDFLGDA